MPTASDFSCEWNPIKPGVYNAVVKAIDFAFNEPIALRISYETETDPPFGLSEYLPLDAPTHHPRYADTAQGKARVVQLAKAAGIDPKTITSINAIPELFTDVRVRIAVELRYRDGLYVPIVRAVLGPATGPEPQAESKPKRRKRRSPPGEEAELA